jgi:RND superfamily putative drug exporter
VPITYDLLGELRRDRPSVRGTELLRRHFAPGETGPLTVLAYRERGGFDSKQGEREIALLTKFLYDIPGVASVRSLAEPTGEPPGKTQLFSAESLVKLAAKQHPITKATFVAQKEEYQGRVARFDLILRYAPFSAEAIALLNHIETKLAELRERNPAWRDARFHFAGTTAGIRDLKSVTESDGRVIQQLVVIAVLAVLLVLLRHPLICLYLILSVLWSYFVTIGAAEVFFAWLYGPGFHGLDWKVPIFLFVILIAVGEDYNIYLVTRVFEEQKTRGPLEGLRAALARTGGIITSCGVIMAGTFVSMTAGSLRGMTELGFALSLGVLLDTFVVRTVLVPAFLALLARRQERRADSPIPALRAGTRAGRSAFQATRKRSR